ncbi:galactosylceramide sulfotransferase-like [Gigantopelta aegis]|uniref:galactosylceramide sulfotransferase-like n=1 Tax=Gigantopelta aegis TaxID=1735272 RepID=UPI001B8882D7|nr:galactosylceramide sulfotransferase-like [Gigantopelta aegis]
MGVFLYMYRRKTSVIILFLFTFVLCMCVVPWLYLDFRTQPVKTNSTLKGVMTGHHHNISDDDSIVLETCKKERRNFVFIKCMKCATESLGTMFRKFGYDRNLSFVLPIKKNLWLGWPYPLSKANFRPSVRGYNILMEHSIYNKSFLQEIMPQNSVYISSIRKPFQHFLSVCQYFELPYYSNKVTFAEKIKDYLENFEHYETIYKSYELASVRRWCPGDEFSMTQNLLSHCLGMPLGFPPGRRDISQDLASAKEYIRFLDRNFMLIMIVEYLHESLVLLRRLMCWSLKDIIYNRVNKGVYDKKSPVTKENINLHKNISRIDYLLYDYFNATFWNKVGLQGKDFFDEVAMFTRIINDVTAFCRLSSDHSDSSIAFPESKWSTDFTVSRQECELQSKYLPILLKERYDEQEGHLHPPIDETKVVLRHC